MRWETHATAVRAQMGVHNAHALPLLLGVQVLVRKPWRLTVHLMIHDQHLRRLTELWRRREDGRLTHHAYEQIGGVVGGLARWCNQAYQALPEAQRPLARRIIMSLVRLGDEAANIPPTRQRRTHNQLRVETTGTPPGGDSEIDAVVAALADRRLLVTSRDPTTGEPVVELVHEALSANGGC